MVTVDASLPQLLFLLWNRTTRELTESDALALYEANRAWVDPAAMTAHERGFYDDLVARVGGGVSLVGSF